MSPHMKGRGWPRFQAYLPVQCTALGPEPSHPRPLTGKTEWISGAGIALLLPETLPVGTPVLVQFGENEPRRGHVVWFDQRMWTPLGTTVPHRVTFDQPVDPDVIRHWLSDADTRHEARVPVRLVVRFESIQTGMTDKGMCVDLSRGGMFISTDRPEPRGTEVLLYFKLPNISHTLSVLAQVVWMRKKELVAVDQGEIWTSGITGMGVRFLDVNPLEATLISTFVDRLCSEASPSLDSCPSDKDKEEGKASPARSNGARDVADGK